MKMERFCIICTNQFTLKEGTYSKCCSFSCVQKYISKVMNREAKKEYRRQYIKLNKNG